MKITQEQRLQLIGLLTLGIKYQKMVSEVEKTMNEITGEELGGHLNDAIYNDDLDIDNHLKNADIEVEDATA